MKDQILENIRPIVQFLKNHDWPEKALWYEKMHEQLRTSPMHSKNWDKLLRELNQSILGMGSFIDLPLSSTPGVTVNQLRSEQWRLAEELGRVIEACQNLRQGRKV